MSDSSERGTSERDKRAGAESAPGPGGTAPARGPGPPGGFGPGPRAFGPSAAAMPAERSLRFKQSCKRLLGMMRPERLLLVALVALGCVGIGLTVTGPRLLGHATDRVVAGVIGRQLPAGVDRETSIEALRSEGRDDFANLVSTVDVTPGQGVDFGSVGRVLLIVLAVYLVAFALGVLQGRLAALIVQRLVFRLRGQAEGKLGRLPLRYFDGQPRGEVLSRVTNDIDNIAQTMSQALSQLVTSALTIIGVLAMMLWISPLLAGIAVVTVPVSIRLAKAIGKRSQPQFIAQWASTGRLNGHVEEMYTGHQIVTAFGRTGESAATFAEHNEALHRAAFRAQFISGIIQPTMMFISNLGYAAVAVVGGLRVASGNLSIGEVQAFVQYSRQFGQPVTQVAAMANLLQSGIASAERVFDLLDSPEQSPDPTAAPDGSGPARGRVDFEAVSFRYDPDVPLIEDLSLSVAAGRTVAIVGPTGAGKTTLVNLLMRFYELNGGRIMLDGADIAAMPRGQLRACIGMVLQDTWLFGGTIADNIAYGRPGATRDDVVAAARATHVDPFVRTLPHGYDTILDDEGGGLSAGERQLVTIARAFLADRAILVLDEATSSVDTRTEQLVQRATTMLRTGRTSFVIAHRLSTIRDADVILVLDAGRIVEQGHHDALLLAGGAYARLYASQFAQPAAEEI